MVTMCRVLGVSTSGYYQWRQRAPSARALQDAALTQLMARIHQASGGTYGAPRIHAELRLAHGVRCARKRVARLMRQAGLAGVHRRRLRGCTRRDPARSSYPDRIQRDFVASAPDQLWVGDLTQHATDEGWLYLAVVIHVFSRRVVGWSMGDRPTADLVVGAVNMAVHNRRPGEGLIHHPEHGSQYTSLSFGDRLQKAGILGSVGDALDNAVAESFFATLQTELLDRHAWARRVQLRTAIFEYMEVFYNRERRHSALGYHSPAEYERKWYTKQLNETA